MQKRDGGTVIGPNKYQLYGKIFLLSVALPVFALIAWYRPSIDFRGAEHFGKFVLGFVASVLLLLLLLMTLQLFLLPLKVVIDQDQRNITLHFLSGKKTMLPVSELSSFSGISIATRSTSYDGILVKTLTGKAYVLANFHLADTAPLKALLEQNNISFTGKQQFSFIRYFLKKYEG